ncbi:hypothetical protein AGOR_G00154100 [Albula goreensis]|uniref:EF-hand domain-containing protein n=1 Tax=Albula goreensis TaxID=1534307 RepID=A0A8T3D2B9_9TELE|nr:hypothetical protein AGOR_G00154100 [Albula goreensis]
MASRLSFYAIYPLHCIASLRGVAQCRRARWAEGEARTEKYCSLVFVKADSCSLTVENMASDELASKLTRRLNIEDGSEDPVAVENEEQENGDDEKSALANADSELGAKLQRRGELNEGVGQKQLPSERVYNPYTEFKEFSRKQIKDMEKMFKKYDAGKDGFIDLMELKMMMEKLEAPQTHLGLKNMIKEVDEDLDNKLSFREFLMIFRKAAAGELAEDSGLQVLARLSEIDVSTEGVKGAKSFFEAKVQAINDANRFEAEIRQEQEEKKKELEEKKHRKAAFKELQSAFK